MIIIVIMARILANQPMETDSDGDNNVDDKEAVNIIVSKGDE